ncbi:hypothetical protein [Azospirillum sp. Sh1]|uniref:hypothetical protein n=1 Tax=Azospirillum sp. Sh1 TaxID=2607285 RepID=UPI0011EE4F1E|nr:hypothetical protein [Azospirillum sp. Sh1]KAA0576703.1 hypothetical protein FZ029_12625 [Azospirillum sp. Sh1]
MKRSRPFDGEDLSDPTGEGKPQLLRSNDADEIRRWIKYVCYLTNIAPTKLAKGAGIASSTINKFLYDQNYKFIPSSNTLEKIRKFVNSEFRASSIDDLIAYTTVKDPISRYDEKDTSCDVKDVEGPSHSWAVPHMFWPVMIRGHIGHYSDDDRMLFDNSKVYWISVPPSPSYPGIGRYGLEVKDNSMNLVYKKGSIIVCVAGYDIEGTIADIKDGTRVIVEYGKSGQVKTRTIGEIVRDEGGEIWLVPRSSDPKYGNGGGTMLSTMTNPRLYAVVVGSYNPE